VRRNTLEKYISKSVKNNIIMRKEISTKNIPLSLFFRQNNKNLREFFKKKKTNK
jgi:hypothetical protein